jgi:FAD/FMN-containing dehydrogenase
MTHEEKVLNICSQVEDRNKTGQSIKLKKDAVSHFVPNPHDKRAKLPKISIEGLNEILEIDVKNKTCTAEPGITFCDLVEALKPYNLIPYTVPELKTITIGGAISGCSIESMSYKYGGFHDSCLEYEIITGTGEIITCTPETQSNIFHMIHGSYGTLGIISKIKFKLIPSKPFVKMDYITFSDFDAFWAHIQKTCTENSCDFIDAIIHSPTEFVVCQGNMVDNAPQVSNYEWLNIYYKSTRELKEDYLKLEDYLFRYDTECHWLTKTVPLMETKPARLILGKLILGSTNLIKWSKRLRNIMKLKRRPEVVVDVFIPKHNFKTFWNWYRDDYSFYPLWIVPYNAHPGYPWVDDDYAKNTGEPFYIDCAVYGKKNCERKKDYSEILEKKTIELNGIKTLISRNHFDKETFWSVYNKKNYYNVKNTTDPNNLFQDIYTKFRPDNY